jgi:hypothetical protein
MYLHHHQVVQSGGLHQYLPKQLHDALGTLEIFYHYVGGTEPDNKALYRNEINIYDVPASYP